MHYKGKISVSDMRKGIECLGEMGKLLGKDNILYRHAIAGINEKMNTDIEPAFPDESIMECFAAEAIIRNLKAVLISASAMSGTISEMLIFRKSYVPMPKSTK